MAIEVPDWYRTVALVGVDGAGAPVVVLLDSTGAIMAVMKGEYAGTLKNIAVDSSGRVIMIPTDPADVWGNAISMGNAELAARLTGMGGFDRRGNAIWLWDFEHGLGKWDKDLGAGTGAAVNIGTISRNGAYAAKLTAPSDGDLTVIITTDLAFPTLSKMGFEVSFTLAQYTTKVEADLMVYDGTNQYQGLIRYDYGNTRFEYQASDGSWTVLESSLNLDREANCYHTIKIVVDPSTGKYVRAILDDTAHDIDTAAMKSVASALAPHLAIQVKHLGTSGQLPVIYIDSIIVTQNEPANA